MIEKIAELVFDKNEFKGQASIIYYKKCGFQFRQNYTCMQAYTNIILLLNCTMLYYVFSGPLSLRAYVPEINFNNVVDRVIRLFIPMHNFI